MDNIGLTYSDQTTASAGEVQGEIWYSNLYRAPATLVTPSTYLQELEIESPSVVVLGMKTSTQDIIIKMRCVNVIDMLSARYYLHRWHKRHHIPALIAACVDIPSSSSRSVLQCEHHRQRLLKRQLYRGKCIPNLKLWLRKWTYYLYTTGSCARQLGKQFVSCDVLRQYKMTKLHKEMSRAIRKWRVFNWCFKRQACLLRCLFRQWHKVAKQEKFVKLFYRNCVCDAFQRWQRRSRWPEVQRRFIKACKLGDKLSQWRHLACSWNMQHKVLGSFLVVHKRQLYRLMKCMSKWSFLRETRRKWRITHAHACRNRFHAQLTRALLAIIQGTSSRGMIRNAMLRAAVYQKKRIPLLAIHTLVTCASARQHYQNVLHGARKHRYMHVMRHAVHTLLANVIARRRINSSSSGGGGGGGISSGTSSTYATSSMISDMRMYQQLHRINKARILRRMRLYARTRMVLRSQEHAVINNTNVLLGNTAHTGLATDISGARISSSASNTATNARTRSRLLLRCIKRMRQNMRHKRMQQRHAWLARHTHLLNRTHVVFLPRWNALIGAKNRESRHLRAADEHWHNLCVCHAFKTLQKRAFRKGQLDRSCRIFHKLHPLPACSLAKQVFHVWKTEFAPREAHCRVAYRKVRNLLACKVLHQHLHQWLDLSAPRLQNRVCLRHALHVLRKHRIRGLRARDTFFGQVLQRALSTTEQQQLYMLQLHYREHMSFSSPAYGLARLHSRGYRSIDDFSASSTYLDSRSASVSAKTKTKHNLEQRQEHRNSWKESVTAFVESILSEQTVTGQQQQVCLSPGGGGGRAVAVLTNSNQAHEEEAEAVVHLCMPRSVFFLENIIYASNWLLSYRALTHRMQIFHYFQFWSREFLQIAREIRQRIVNQRAVSVRDTASYAFQLQKSSILGKLCLCRHVMRAWKEPIMIRRAAINAIYLHTVMQPCFAFWKELRQRQFIYRMLPVKRSALLADAPASASAKSVPVPVELTTAGSLGHAVRLLSNSAGVEKENIPANVSANVSANASARDKHTQYGVVKSTDSAKKDSEMGSAQTAHRALLHTRTRVAPPAPHTARCTPKNASAFVSVSARVEIPAAPLAARTVSVRRAAKEVSNYNTSFTCSKPHVVLAPSVTAKLNIQRSLQQAQVRERGAYGLKATGGGAGYSQHSSGSGSSSRLGAPKRVA